MEKKASRKSKASSNQPRVKQWTRREFEENIKSWTKEQVNLAARALELKSMCLGATNWEEFYDSFVGSRFEFMLPAAKVLYRTFDEDVPVDPILFTERPADASFTGPPELVGSIREEDLSPEKNEQMKEDERYRDEILKETIKDAEMALSD